MSLFVSLLMGEKMAHRIDGLVGELMRVAQLPMDAKARIVDGHIEAHPTGWLREASRWWSGTHSRQETTRFLTRLYDDVFETVGHLSNTYPLLNVLLPASTALSSIEDQQFLMNKAHLDSLLLWIEKSRLGLNHLHDTYGKAQPVFAILAHKSAQKVCEMTDLSRRLDVAYAAKVKMPPLTSFTVPSLVTQPSPPIPLSPAALSPVPPSGVSVVADDGSSASSSSSSTCNVVSSFGHKTT